MFDYGKGSAILAELPPRKKRATVSNVKQNKENVENHSFPEPCENDETKYNFNLPISLSDSDYLTKKKSKLAQLADSNKNRGLVKILF